MGCPGGWCGLQKPICPPALSQLEKATSLPGRNHASCQFKIHTGTAFVHQMSPTSKEKGPFLTGGSINLQNLPRRHCRGQQQSGWVRPQMKVNEPATRERGPVHLVQISFYSHHDEQFRWNSHETSDAASPSPNARLRPSASLCIGLAETNDPLGLSLST